MSRFLAGESHVCTSGGSCTTAQFIKQHCFTETLNTHISGGSHVAPCCTGSRSSSYLLQPGDRVFAILISLNCLYLGIGSVCACLCLVVHRHPVQGDPQSCDPCYLGLTPGSLPRREDGWMYRTVNAIDIRTFHLIICIYNLN